MSKPPITATQVDTIEEDVEAVIEDAHATRRLTAVQRQTLGRVLHEAVPLLRDIAAGAVPGYGDTPDPAAPPQANVDPPASGGPPPRNGAGSGRDAWVEYAAKATDAPATAYGALGRDEIIALLEEEGVIDAAEE